MELAITGFYDGEEAFGAAVHTARKATKKVRGLLRLVRSEVGEKVYRFENAALRDTARLISPIRSAAVMVQAIEVIEEAYRPLLAEDAFAETRARLEVNRSRVEARAMEDPILLPRVVVDLERAHSRYSAWPTDPHARAAYRSGIRDSFQAVGPGLVATYRRGRWEMVAAYRDPSPANFHRWRKRAKYLMHQFEILTPLWPEVVIGMVITLDRISGLLGEDHDLADLLVSIAERPDLCPDPVERSLIRALGEQRRSEIEVACRILGRRLYADRPSALKGRFRAYWETMEQARALALSLNGG